MEKFHSRILGILLSLALMFSLTPAAYAAGVRDLRLQTALAAQLKELDLFLGVGVLEDGSTDFDLDRAPSRVEAVTMLVRSLGKGVQAELQPKTHPFTDVPAWADGYVSYAYDLSLIRIFLVFQLQLLILALDQGVHTAPQDSLEPVSYTQL